MNGKNIKTTLVPIHNKINLIKKKIGRKTGQSEEKCFKVINFFFINKWNISQTRYHIDNTLVSLQLPITL